jgi:hypothetical protein
MELTDLLTTIWLAIGAGLGVIFLILRKKNILTEATWPRGLAIGAAAFQFVALMISTFLLSPRIEVLSYIPTAALLSVFLGIVVFIGGHMIVKRGRDSKRGGN